MLRLTCRQDGEGGYRKEKENPFVIPLESLRSLGNPFGTHKNALGMSRNSLRILRKERRVRARGGGISENPKDSYGGAPSKNHSGEDVAILPNGHKSGSAFPRYHEEQAANNDLQRCRSIQESWQPVAQPCALFALYRAKGDGTEMSLIDELVFNKNPLWAEA